MTSLQRNNGKNNNSINHSNNNAHEIRKRNSQSNNTNNSNRLYSKDDNATDASLTCDGTGVNPYPTIQEADNHIGYQTDLVIMLNQGTCTGDGNKIYFFEIARRVSIDSHCGGELTVIDCEFTWQYYVKLL